MKGLVTPFLLFSHASTVCLTIPQYKSAFSFVPVDSSVLTKDLSWDNPESRDSGDANSIVLGHLDTISTNF